MDRPLNEQRSPVAGAPPDGGGNPVRMSDDHADHADHAETETPYLALLARGAPAGEYEHPVLRARADGATPDRIAALDRAKHLALRVRAELEDRRRREAELSALFATAHDLAGLRDLDAVLHAIVQRARTLLGTDVAYLTLHDAAAGDTYMRVTDGSGSARFQQLRLGMGEGLGGLVAQTARPYVTDDYFDDPRFQHTRAIDSGVRDEGLVAILGVPLKLGSRVIGVLFAADRRARAFERGQTALLASFAAHAAVAIDTANLLAETRSALAGLEAANEIIRDRSAVIERASDVHDRLTALVLHGGDVHDVAAAVAESLGGQVTFLEADQCPAAAVDRSRAVRHEDGWYAAVSAGGELLGALVLHGHPALDPVDQRTLERAAMVTSLLQLAGRQAGEAEQRVRGELLDDLLDAPGRDPRLLRERAARLRADLDTPHVVLAARVAEGAEATAPDPGSGLAEGAPSADHRQRLWSAASHLAATRHGLAAARDGGTVLLLPHDGRHSASEEARRAARQLGAAVPAGVTVGASAPVPAPAADPGAVAGAYAEARRCLDVLHVLGRDGEGAAADDFGFVGLLLAEAGSGGGGGDRIDRFVARTIGPVVDYDTRRGTVLIPTLDAYFAGGMSPARTKDALHVHVNTVAQRLDRVGCLLGADWQTPARSLEIQLALRLHRLAAPSPPSDRRADHRGHGGASPARDRPRPP
ncbi:cyclic diguanylate phosphodiesterase [Streptomyces hiroshimensis]|uniref:Cyclic diguanylate phosphodiesterase n=1 Tax=Streptomyces hiroshimensis TaxID=66424 RepID=A0ABQ2Y8W4_9ACTN|nr:cyclic diguanylate phosphodiesterase [Streptomyces hiroshimensis]